MLTRSDDVEFLLAVVDTGSFQLQSFFGHFNGYRVSRSVTSIGQ